MRAGNEINLWNVPETKYGIREWSRGRRKKNKGRIQLLFQRQPTTA